MRATRSRAELANRGRSAVLDARRVERADQQCVIGVRIVLMVLREVVQRSGFAGRVVPGDGEHRYVDARELIAERQPLLPEPVVARVIQPAAENRAGATRQCRKLAIADGPIGTSLRRCRASEHRRSPLRHRAEPECHRPIDRRSSGRFCWDSARRCRAPSGRTSRSPSTQAAVASPPTTRRSRRSPCPACRRGRRSTTALRSTR